MYALNSRSSGNLWHQAAFALAGISIAALAGLADESVSESASLGTLEVVVTGFETDRGRLAIALFARPEDYATQQNAVRKAWLDIRRDGTVWTVDRLPDGEYAVIAYHDENGNERIDMRLLGLPKEPVGVSNDARGLFGPPRFNEAKFEVAAPLTRLRIELR